MDVSELLAQKHNLLAERRSAPDEVEFTLTERELDYRIRKAFADRERNVENQVRKLLAEHMREAENRIAEALPGIATVIHEVRRQLRREFADEIAKVESQFDLRVSAMLAEVEKRQRAIGGDRGEVIDLPPVLRSKRRA